MRVFKLYVSMQYVRMVMYFKEYILKQQVLNPVSISPFKCIFIHFFKNIWWTVYPSISVTNYGFSLFTCFYLKKDFLFLHIYKNIKWLLYIYSFHFRQISIHCNSTYLYYLPRVEWYKHFIKKSLLLWKIKKHILCYIFIYYIIVWIQPITWVVKA